MPFSLHWILAWGHTIKGTILLAGFKNTHAHTGYCPAAASRSRRFLHSGVTAGGDEEAEVGGDGKGVPVPSGGVVAGMAGEVETSPRSGFENFFQ